jgi:hypothetical protein
MTDSGTRVLDPIRAHAIVDELERKLGVHVEPAADAGDPVDFAYASGETPD